MMLTLIGNIEILGNGGALPSKYKTYDHTEIIQNTAIIILFLFILGLLGIAVFSSKLHQTFDAHQHGFSQSFKFDPIAILTFFLVVIALIQAILFWWQLNLIREGINDTRLAASAAKVAADAAIESNKITQDLFVAEHRPWVSIEVKPSGPMSWKENGVHIALDVVLDNLGNTPATDGYFEIRGFACDITQDQRVQVERLGQFCNEVLKYWSEKKYSGRTIFKGKKKVCPIVAYIPITEIRSNPVMDNLFAPMIRVCTVYKGVGLSEFRYTGILYSVVDRSRRSDERKTIDSGMPLVEAERDEIPLDGYYLMPYNGHGCELAT